MKNKSITSLRSDRGVGGLTILLSVVAMIFVIGFLLLIFVVIGSNLSYNSLQATTNTVNNESTNGLVRASANASGYSLATSGYFQFRDPTSVIVWNTTATGASGFKVPSTNFTVSSAGVLTNATATTYNFVNVTYTYTYDANTTASNSITSTSNSLSSVTSWFPIIITITVMVALILLTVIIIVAIRSTGLLQGGQ